MKINDLISKLQLFEKMNSTKEVIAINEIGNFVSEIDLTVLPSGTIYIAGVNNAIDWRDESHPRFNHRKLNEIHKEQL